MKKVFLLFLAVLLPAASVFCVDWMYGPESLWPGDTLISGGLALGNVSVLGFRENSSGFNVTVDYALKIGYGLAVGGEFSYLKASNYGITASAVPIQFRFSYHPDFQVPNLDVYGIAKLGVTYGSADDGGSSIGSTMTLGLGIGAGLRYYFTETIAGFAELGIDSYTFNVGGIEVTARKIFTLGLTYRDRNSSLWETQ
jgi:opacity protein-like surface antigen